MSATHFRLAGPVEQRFRKLYSDMLSRFGIVPHIMRAQGARFSVDPSDTIDQSIAIYGMWEQAQLEDLAEVATRRKIDAFIDAGANSGFYSIMFAIKNLADRIIAFEPDPNNFARLKKNIEANGLSNRIETVPLALGNSSSDVTMYQGAKWNLGESTIAVPEQTPQEVVFQVQQARFDDLYRLSGQSLIVKIDVEGYEFETLSGCERTLRDNSCYLQIEHYGERHEELKSYMATLGYRYLRTEYIDLYFTNISDTAAR